MSTPDRDVPTDEETRVDPCPGGPLLVRGATTWTDSAGVTHPVTRPVVAVCRCDRSQRQPWCDGTHKFVTHRLLPSLAVLLGILLLSGCGSTHQDDVRQAAGDFQRAVGDHDWRQACARLSPLTREELVESAGSRCDEALAEEQLPQAGHIDEVAVFGTTAQVRYEGETLFLARFDDTWRVVAAGCTAQRPKPYDCLLQGG